MSYQVIHRYGNTIRGTWIDCYATLKIDARLIRSCCFQTYSKANSILPNRCVNSSLSHVWEALICPSLVIQKIHQHCFYPGIAYGSLLPSMEFNLFFLWKSIFHDSVHSAQAGTTLPHI